MNKWVNEILRYQSYYDVGHRNCERCPNIYDSKECQDIVKVLKYDVNALARTTALSMKFQDIEQKYNN